jgi:5-methylcytosine-specific restriction protein A
MGQFAHLYNTKRWRKKRLLQLMAHPLCVMCAKTGRVEIATIADHVIEHKGDLNLFWYGELQSLCKLCHDSLKKQIEGKGYHTEIGNDGWPTDANHPANINDGKQPFSIPRFVKHSAIPVHLVCGPPGSGKTTFVKANAKPGDVVIDYDDIRQAISGNRYDTNSWVRHRAFQYRDKLIHALHTKCDCAAWLVVMAPTEDERTAWVSALGALCVIHAFDVDASTCKQRIRGDTTRHVYAEALCCAVDAYYVQRDANNFV